MNTELAPLTDYQNLSDRALVAEIDHLDKLQRFLPPAEYIRRKGICSRLLANRRDARGIQQFQALIDNRQAEIARLMDVT